MQYKSVQSVGIVFFLRLFCGAWNIFHIFQFALRLNFLMCCTFLLKNLAYPAITDVDRNIEVA